MKRLKIILLVVITIYGCREPFNFDYEEVENPQVVIEGFITDRDTLHDIRVSYSTNINDRGLIETQFIENASVRIEDDQGNFTTLRHREAGIYRTAPQYSAEEGRSYTVVVTLPNGEEYRSVTKTLPPPSPATAQLSYTGDTRQVLVENGVVEEEYGAQINATITKDGQRHFYQWIVNHYFIYEADLASSEEIRFCYVQEFDDTRVELLQDNPVTSSEAVSYDYELDFIPVTRRTRHDFAVQGRLLTLNEEDYNFWDKVKRLIENTGGIFDAAPFTIEGNIFNANTGERTLGYFGVYRESMDRIHFAERDLDLPPKFLPPCVPPPGAPPDFHCFDCRTLISQENFGNVRPYWWIN